MIKPSPWNGRDLTGEWEVTIKVDGWRALWNGSEWRSRADKPIPNIPPWRPGMATDCEVYGPQRRCTGTNSGAAGRSRL
ncbi:hypothetical protein HUU61_12845 [Rhodopseudomonas palustris]|nr:hypothetical protein [Rhodopseudomonas palustris]